LGTFANRAWLVIAAATVVLSATIAIADEVPRRDLTPGAWRPEIDLRQVCATKWGRDQRHVTKAMKDRVYRAYGVGRTTAYCKRAGCEVDHRIPRDLGGADEVENLWPQPYAGRWNAHTKDRLEAWAKRAVCITGGLTLAEARAMFAGDWRRAYQRHIPQLRKKQLSARGGRPLTFRPYPRHFA
jgi:hypothetical protein